MTAPAPEIPPAYIEYMHQLAEIEQTGGRVSVDVGPFTAMTLIGALQLAVRHPWMGDQAKAAVRALVDGFGPMFAGTLGEQIIAAGWRA